MYFEVNDKNMTTIFMPLLNHLDMSIFFKKDLLFKASGIVKGVHEVVVPCDGSAQTL